MRSGIGREDPDPSLECVCPAGSCIPTCEACADYGSCVPAFMKRDGPSEKDRRRDRFHRHRNGTKT